MDNIKLTILTIFSVQFSALNIFAILYNHHRSVFPEFFDIPEWNSIPFE